MVELPDCGHATGNIIADRDFIINTFAYGGKKPLMISYNVNKFSRKPYAMVLQKHQTARKYVVLTQDYVWPSGKKAKLRETQMHVVKWHTKENWPNKRFIACK